MSKVKIFILLILASFLFSCAFPQANGTQQSLMKNSSTNPASDNKGGNNMIYSEFGDISMPIEMTKILKDSFTITVPGSPYPIGLVTLRGNVDGESLINFFKQSMYEASWEMVTSLISLRSLLVFRKDGRICIITVDSGKLTTTQAEIWVGNLQSQTIPVQPAKKTILKHLNLPNNTSNPNTSSEALGGNKKDTRANF